MIILKVIKSTVDSVVLQNIIRPVRLEVVVLRGSKILIQYISNLYYRADIVTARCISS